MIKLIACFFFGFTFGFIFHILLKPAPCGWLRIDRSEPSEPPMLFLELNCSVDTISKKDEIILSVKNENFLSQE